MTISDNIEALIGELEQLSTSLDGKSSHSWRNGVQLRYDRGDTDEQIAAGLRTSIKILGTLRRLADDKLGVQRQLGPYQCGTHGCIGHAQTGVSCG